MAFDSLVIGPPGQEQVYALASADRPYRLIVQAMNEGAATISPRGIILDTNPRLLSMTGRTRGDLTGTAVLGLVPEDRRAAFGHLLDVGAGQGARGESELAGPEGSGVPVQVSVSGFDLDGLLLRCLVLTDLTAQRAAEDQARHASRYARSLLEASLDPLVTISPDGRITDVNEAAIQVTGLPRDQLVGTEFSDYFTDPGRARAGYEQVFRDGSVRDYALELRHRDGHTTSVLYNASVYRDASGRVLGVFAAARDVTQTRRAQAAQHESRERLSAIFDHAPVGIDDTTPDGEFVRVNPGFTEITGYSAAELRSMRLDDLVHPGDRAADRANRRRLLSGEADTYAITKRYLRKDGGVVWAQVNRAVVRDPDGHPLLLVGVVRDITAQRRAEGGVRTLTAELETRVRQRTAELERANRNLEAFTYSVSHDLRAPLRALSGFSGALLEEYGGRLDDTGRGYAGRIQEASGRMAALIADLLQLSRVSRASIAREPVDLSAEVAAIVGELRLREPGREVRCAVQEGVRASADPTLIRTVLENLVENAWKFTARRDGAVIEFGTTPAGGREICCYVRDNGAGFDPAYAHQLFQPFQRLHRASEFPGTGIGLASVRQIVERHGGRVWAEGAVDEGATFRFTLGPGEPGESPDAEDGAA